MIVLVKIGDGCGAASRYNINKLAKNQGEFLCATVARTDDPTQIGREFEAITALKPRVKKSIVHLVIAISPKDADKGTAFNFRYWLFELQKRLHLDETQMIAWQHFDTDHPHIHALINRVKPNGEVVSMWRRGQVMKQFCIEMRKKFVLNSSPRVDVKKDFLKASKDADLGM